VRRHAAAESAHVFLTTDESNYPGYPRHSELNGYLASRQGADDRIHLISSRNYYVFNLARLTEGTPFASAR
jgi:hypothetical protein